MSDTDTTDTVTPEPTAPETDSFAKTLAKSFSINAAGSAGMLVGLGIAAVVVDKIRTRKNRSDDNVAVATDTTPTEA